MKVKDWQAIMDGQDPEAKLIVLFEGQPRERWKMTLYYDTTQEEPTLVLWMSKDPVDREKLA